MEDLHLKSQVFWQIAKKYACNSHGILYHSTQWYLKLLTVQPSLILLPILMHGLVSFHLYVAFENLHLSAENTIWEPIIQIAVCLIQTSSNFGLKPLYTIHQ